MTIFGSNNTNKLSPQEQSFLLHQSVHCSNNTNKLSPQERVNYHARPNLGSNNTNKLSPQEHSNTALMRSEVQIIQINLVLKNE